MTPTTSMLRHSPAYGEPPVPLVQIIGAMVRDIPALTVVGWVSALLELVDAGHLTSAPGQGGPLYARTALGEAALLTASEVAA